MFSRSLRTSGRITFKRLQHTAQAAKESTFNNKYNFNLNPPPVHEYWNIYNSSLLFMLVPLIAGVGYFGKWMGSGLDGFAALLSVANSENSPMKELHYGQSQASSRNQQ
ncbi:uncharacterized protein J8A68_003612 [[Candida] subhashii]|uniref:Uncharacterized protein n=1 Tax=[Candida] subhashii TaxID=561895 RepID=A0A8J5QM42_9ASCO|nr:uncharacterized protein J8A68_003612 [[Candida] subhashii]KAG7662842.1 hypothetical protein J8A68_003612 [[Candida] subhashii]